jgi:hypothetical protein
MPSSAAFRDHTEERSGKHAPERALHLDLRAQHRQLPRPNCERVSSWRGGDATSRPDPAPFLKRNSPRPDGLFSGRVTWHSGGWAWAFRLGHRACDRDRACQSPFGKFGQVASADGCRRIWVYQVSMTMSDRMWSALLALGDEGILLSLSEASRPLEARLEHGSARGSGSQHAENQRAS